LFSNHFKGQDTLHIDVYDEDTITDEKIGSVQIDLKDLYQKGF
jgi:Ca2+-dependent lipid-binding protein